MITYILYNIILLTTLSALLLIAYQLLEKLTTKSTDIFQYKVKHFHVSWNIVEFYIGFFVIFLYGLRIYNLPREINIKAIITNIIVPLEFIYHNIFITIILIFNIIGLVIFLLFILVLFSIKISHHIFILYLYHFYQETSEKTWKTKIDAWLHRLSYKDILSYYINALSYKITGYIDNPDLYIKLKEGKMVNSINPYNFNYPWYRIDGFIRKLLLRIIFNKRYPLFVTFSPVLVILYDCIFNNFIITHVFYYLIIYVPIILLRKLSTMAFNYADYITRLLWNIYYKKENCIYAISQNDKKLLNIYLLSGLKREVNLGLEAEMYLKEAIRFQLKDSKRNEYVNFLDNILIKNPDGRYYEELYDKDMSSDSWGEPIEGGEAWILIVDKTTQDYNFNNINDVD